MRLSSGIAGHGGIFRDRTRRCIDSFEPTNPFLRFRGGRLETSTVRVLVVDDFGPWRRFVRSTFQTERNLCIVGEATEGLEAIQRANETKPDLILLDFGLSKLDGIEAAKRIRQILPRVKILVASQYDDPDAVSAALNNGVDGYIWKMDAPTELLPAIETVLRGEKFLSRSVKQLDPSTSKSLDDPDGLRRE